MHVTRGDNGMSSRDSNVTMASMDDMSAVDNMSMPMFIMNTMSVTMTMVH